LDASDGYRPATISHTVRTLKAVARRTNLLEPEKVKGFLGKAEVSENRKIKICEDLDRFYKLKHIPFQKPQYQRIEKLPWIPLEQEVNAVIAAVGMKTSCFLQLLKETGVRPGEAWQLTWMDINGNIITITPEKNSNPRQFKVSEKLMVMLNLIPRRHDYVFRRTPNSELRNFRRVYIRQRNNIALRLGNPRIKKVSFKTLRHFKATMEYQKTKDILHVMQILGHKNIRSTLVYTHLVSFESDDYVCKVAKTVKEASELVESGFDYVTDVEGYKMFGKRKFTVRNRQLQVASTRLTRHCCLVWKAVYFRLV